MKRSLLAAAAMLLLATTANATNNAKILSRSGAWETYITTSDKGNPLCGMQVFGSNSAMMIKYFVGSEMLIHIYKIGWRIPDGTKIPGYIRFDNGERVEVSGFGGKSTGQSGISYVEFRIKVGAESEFLNEFGAANKMVIGFDEGTQLPFHVNMSGSRTAAGMFGKCMAYIDGKAADAPQPFAKPPTPQPFGQQPAQPFGNGSTQPVKKPGKRDDGSV